MTLEGFKGTVDPGTLGVHAESAMGYLRQAAGKFKGAMMNMKTKTMTTYKANMSTRTIATPIALKDCPLCGGTAAMHPGRMIYNHPSMYIRCEACHISTAHEGYNVLIMKKVGEGFRFYSENECISDLCQKWNDRTA